MNILRAHERRRQLVTPSRRLHEQIIDSSRAVKDVAFSWPAKDGR